MTIDGNSSGSLGGSYDIDLPAIIKQGTEPLISFNHNFSDRAINFSNWKIVKQADALLVNGIDLAEGETKNFTLDFPSKSICVKDAAVSQVDNISENCDGEFEIYFINTECEANTSKRVNDHIYTALQAEYYYLHLFLNFFQKFFKAITHV